jgi:predicted  nucleic acid-binding Zn-ribbon protein
VFAVLLRRSRKAQQQLLARLADQEKHPAESIVATETPVETPGEVPDAPWAEIDLAEIEVPAVEAPAVESAMVEAPPIDAPEIEPAEIEAELFGTTDASVTSELDQLRESIDNAKLDESVARLQQRLGTTSQSLQRLASEFQQQSTTPGQGHPEIASLQLNLLEMTTEVDSLLQSNALLQQDLRDKTQAIQQTAAQRHDHQERVLQHAKKLRGGIATLRDKLKDSEGDVQRLQSEKEALATEYAALNKEYERIYANSPK